MGDEDFRRSKVIVDLKVRRCETPEIVLNVNSVYEQCLELVTQNDAVECSSVPNPLTRMM